MPVRVHLATTAASVVHPLAELLATPPADPFAEELVAVPTRGVERWLAQSLARRLGARPGRRDGVAARIAFRFPGWVIGRALAGDEDPDRDPWRPDATAWILLDIVTGDPYDECLRPLAAHVGLEPGPDDPRAARRMRTLRHVADLFDRYAMYRPEMVAAWAAGRDIDGAGVPVRAELAWQPHLWRLLRARVGRPALAECLDEACARIRGGNAPGGLPERIAVVGVSRLPPTYRRVLAAVGERRTVEVFLLHPSPALWDAIGAAGGLPDGPRGAAPATDGAALHPLLSSWGRDAREMPATFGADARALPDPAARTSLLGRIQADVRANRAPSPPRPLARSDRSLQIHSCHGRTRQVEALRDALLHLFAADPTLEPRDVAIVSPDIAGFAPLLEAVFGTGAGGDAFPGRGLRVEVADRSIGITNPVVAAVTRMLALAGARISLTEVLELAGLEPVRRRFGFDDGDLSRIEELAAEAGVRWGLDAGDRARFGLGGLEVNTWRSGLDRMVLGLTVGAGDDRPIAGVAPLAGLDLGEIDLLGRLLEFIDRVGLVAGRLRAAQPLGAWVAAIDAAADLLTAVDADRAWQRLQLGEMLTELGEAAAGVAVPVTLAEVRGLMDARADARRGSARYGTGRITAASMVPLRGVPFRVIALLGLDDAVFPRAAARDADDLTLRPPYVGDRDARGDDLQQLLDAMMAASDALIVTYSGHDERTNRPRSPAVPVAELIELAGRMVRDPLGHKVIMTHPLQPFDAGNFRPGGVAEGIVWGFDPAAAAGARAVRAAGVAVPRFLERDLPPGDAEVVDLAALARFAEHPVREFLRARLGVRLGRAGDELPDCIPVTVTGLEEWAIGDRMLRAARGGVDLDGWTAGERVRGSLPPGALGQEALDRIAPTVGELATAALAVQAGRPPRAVGVDIALADGRRLVGAVPEVYGDEVVIASYSQVKPRLRIRAWVYLLALSAADPAVGARATVIGRRPGQRGRGPGVAIVDGLDGDAARAALGSLVALYDDGMRRVPMIFCETSAEFALWRTGPNGADAAVAAWTARHWTRGFDSPVPGENEDPAHELVLGGRLDFDEFWARHGAEVAAQSLRLWGGLLARERRNW